MLELELMQDMTGDQKMAYQHIMRQNTKSLGAYYGLLVVGGWLGLHRFYLGDVTSGVFWLIGFALTLITFGAFGIILALFWIAELAAGKATVDTANKRLAVKTAQQVKSLYM